MAFFDIKKSDVVFAISAFILIGLTILFQWSVWEFVFAGISIIIANYAGTMKQDKRYRKK